MNAIQRISQDLLREYNGTPFNPIGNRPVDLKKPRETSERQARRHEESRRLMGRLTGFAG